MDLIQVDVFNLDVAVFDSQRSRFKELTAQGCDFDEYHDSNLASSHKDFTKDGELRFNFVIKPHASKAVWAHECCHMADFICDTLGIPISEKNGEVRAYLVQHLYQGLEDILG